MSHQEIQIAPGVYITDFRPNGQLKGIQQPKNELTNDVGLLLDDCHTLQSKSNQLQYTIEEIKKEENWEEDGDFREAVEEDWAVLVRFSGEMKEKILKLAQLKYHPETAKIQELLDLQRIDKRQQRARQQLSKISQKHDQKWQKESEKMAVEVQEEDGGIIL